MLDSLNNWRLPRKMLVAFSFIAVLTALLVTVAVLSTNRIADIADEHVAVGLTATADLGDLRALGRQSRSLLYNHVVERDAAAMAKVEERVTTNQEAINETIDRFSSVARADLATDIANLKASFQRLDAVNARIIEASRQGDDAATHMLQTEGRAANNEANDLAEALSNKVIERAKARGVAGRESADTALLIIYAVAALSAGILILVWQVLNRGVTRPLGELVSVTTGLAEGRDAHVPHREREDELGDIAKAVELFRLAAVARQAADAEIARVQQLVTSKVGEGLSAIAEGDLTAEITTEFPPEVASLRTDFNAAIARLREMIAAANASTQGIRTGSQEIAQAAEDLARRTESNAASLEETSAAVAQIDERLKATASSASRTVERADEAIETVSSGRNIAEEAVQAMDRVSESAKGIDQVIEGVDKIAFQTRVLAMNAAVEAGRAGDAGRGFAVVADLVSALAMRAEEEAKRARDQLTVTQSDIVTAVNAVQRVDGALETISGGVGEVHTLLGQMAEDNQAQSAAITQISAAIGSMDQSTQQNAAMVEEASAAARNLTEEAALLATQAGMFKTGQVVPPTATITPIRTQPAPAKYVSPVKALPVASANAATAEDWSDF